MDAVTAVQAWIVADATIRAQHEAQLAEQVFHDHLSNFCQRLMDAQEKEEQEWRDLRSGSYA